MKQLFVPKNFKESSLLIIEEANDIINEYRAQGFILTLRQLYYQFVARGLIENTMRSYKRMGSIINDARLAGLLNWEAIEDRTRNLEKNFHFDSPAGAIEVIRDQYEIDMWANQPERVEVWVEKEALVGVISKICEPHDVPYFACRGYVSQSEQWRSYCRILDHWDNRDQVTTILHLGDHDPSGIDMTRDNKDRLEMFLGDEDPVNVERIALNMDQIESQEPPPNPAKQTDSRFSGYVDLYGEESWELDALDPTFLTNLISDKINEHKDSALWHEKREQQNEEIEELSKIIGDLT